MFKVETSVYVALVTMVISLSAHAVDPAPAALPAQVTGGTDKCTAWLYTNNESKIKMAQQNGISPSDMFERLCPSATPVQSCSAIQAEFTKQQGIFEGSCQPAGYPTGSGGTSGNIGCSYNIERCNCLNPEFKSQGTADLRCEDAKATTSKSTLSKQAQTNLGLIDLAAEERKIKLCPDMDEEDASTYQKQLESAQERLKALKKEVPELANKASDEQEKSEEKINEAARKQTEVQKDLAKQLQEIKRNKEGALQQAVNEMATLRQQIDQVDGQIRDLEISKVTAEIEAQNQKTSVDMQCHSKASQDVANEQAAEMKNVAAGIPSADFSRLMNKVGVSTRKAWEARAKVYYTRCVGARPALEMKAQISSALATKISSINTQISTARQQRFRMEENISLVMSSNGCGMIAPSAANPTGESKMCQAARQAQEDMQEAAAAAKAEQDQAQTEQITALKSSDNKQDQIMAEAQAKQQEINDETTRLENLRAYLDLKKKSAGTPGKKAASVKLHEAYGQLKVLAPQVDKCCLPKDGVAQIKDTTACKKVGEFMDAVGLERAVVDHRDDPEPSTPRTNSEIQNQPRTFQGPINEPGTAQ